jgi:hypothetical protein
MGIGDAMINTPFDRGQALALLALTPSRKLLPQLRLPLADYATVAALVRSLAQRCTPAAYHPIHDMWFVHTDALDQLFWAEAPKHLLQTEIDALTRWFARGVTLPQKDFPTAFWIDALTRMRGADWVKDGMSPEEIEPINMLISDFWEAWRDPEYVDLCDALRGATLAEDEVALCERFNINFFDDVLDPLVIFHNLRKGNILHQVLLARSDTLPLHHMHRLADALLATPDGQLLGELVSVAELDRVRADIWTIRGA